MTRATSELRCTRCCVLLKDTEARFCFLNRCHGQEYCIECQDVHELQEHPPRPYPSRRQSAA